MKIPRPSIGYIVLVYNTSWVRPRVAVVIDVREDNPLAVAVEVIAPFGHDHGTRGGMWLNYTDPTMYWRYPPREDRMVEVPDDAAPVLERVETIVGMVVGEHGHSTVVAVHTSNQRVLLLHPGATPDDYRCWRELPPITDSKKLWP